MDDIALDTMPQYSAKSSASRENHDVDLEQKGVNDAYLMNHEVKNFSWKGVRVTVKDRHTKEPKHLLEDVDGLVEAGTLHQPATAILNENDCANQIPGELCALMGPSGSGKTTLLNALARRDVATNATFDGDAYVNGSTPSTAVFRQISSYVEQEDALIGSLTVEETLDYAARLAHDR